MNDNWKIMMEERAKTSKLRHNTWRSIEAGDFDAFCDNFNQYLNKGWPRQTNDIKGVVHTLGEWRTLPGHQDRVIEYFLKGEFANQSVVLMAYWTHPQNEKFAQSMREEPHEKYKELLYRGFTVSEEMYDAYCSLFNIEAKFMDNKKQFFTEQKKAQAFLLSQKLDKQLNNDDKPVIRKKI